MSDESSRSKLVGGMLRLCAQSFVEVMARLHWRMARFLAEKTADAWWLSGLDGRKQIGTKNIQNAFPDMSTSQARRLLRESARSFCVALADAFQFRQKVLMGDWRDSVEFHGEELLTERDEGQGLIFVTAHFGCWEAAGVALAKLGYPPTSVVRGMPYDALDQYIRQLRETGGQKVVDKEGALRQLVSTLRHGGHVALLIDQDARRDGVFVDFMGRPSSVHTSIARLSISTGCPVAFVASRTEGAPPTVNVRITRVVSPREDAEKEEEIYRISQRLMDEAEKAIKRDPGDWLWTQKQWKTYPGKFTEGTTPMRGVLDR